MIRSPICSDVKCAGGGEDRDKLVRAVIGSKGHSGQLSDTLSSGGIVTGGIVTGGIVTGGIVTGGVVTGGIVTGGVVIGVRSVDEPPHPDKAAKGSATASDNVKEFLMRCICRYSRGNTPRIYF